MIVLYVLTVLVVLQGIYTLFDGVRAARFMRTGGNHRSWVVATQPVAVFCPCKGVDFEFEKNIRSILDQDFSNFAAYFVVESQNDPAYAVLKNLGASNILVAGQATDCGQKVHNLRFAIEQAGERGAIYVFCDSDARYPKDWLKRITAPLADDEVGITTGYRWYIASRFHIPTLLRSAWNASVASLLGDHDGNFAWGGSVAMRRTTFERIGVLDAWRGAVSDDYAITRAAKQAGLKIHFIPSCLIPSHGACSFGELLEFTTRQIIITRVYHPGLWRLGFIAQSVFNITFIWLTIATPLQWGWFAIYGLSAMRSAVRLSSVKSVLNDPSLSRFAWFYILSSPIVSLIYQYNMVVSALTTDIEWRQIHYTLISPNETRVRR